MRASVNGLTSPNVAVATPMICALPGTERGVTEPSATFSACFGAAFLTLHPTRYADLLQEKLETHGAHAYLVNTGRLGSVWKAPILTLATWCVCFRLYVRAMSLLVQAGQAAPMAWASA